MVAGKEQMVAVIDAAAKHRVDIGTGPAAGEFRRLMQHHALPGLHQPAGRGQPGQPGADHLHAHEISSRPTNASLRHFGSETRPRA